LPWRLVALNARGFALLRQGKAAEAVAPLRTAAALGGPLASEVERNLALALKEIGETEEAKKVFLMACWRRKVDRPVCYGGKPGMDGDPFDPSRATRAPAALVYDLSAGVDGTLPVFKHPTQTAQFKAFIKFSQREAKASQEFLQKEAAWAATFNKKGLGSRTKTPADRRAMDIEHTLETIHLDPDVAPLYKAMKDGEADAKRLLDAHYTAGMKKMREILTSGTKDAQEQLRALNEESVAHAVASAQAFDTQLRAYWKVAGRYITGLAANVKDPDWHEKFVHDVAAAKWAIWGQLVVKVYGFYHQANGVGLPNPAEAEVEVPEMPGVEEDEVKSCSQGLKGKMVEFASGPLSITLDCESVGIEFSPEGVLSGFVSVEANVEGKVTVFAGPKLDVTVPGVLHGFTVRDGVYIVGDAKGIEDAGFRVHMETFEKHGEVRFKANFDQMDFSLMPSIH
ncbi:MAG TPA: hypothetical protein VEN81_10975, partial [Planctomycetota bacterium]|nr:hypothetical protein [Planctomycetota bacterium]